MLSPLASREHIAMRSVLQHIELKAAEFARRPLFGYLLDGSGSAEEKLALMPCMAHFVFSFMDINRFVLPDITADNEYQKLVNIHAEEDAWHWPWYLNDLRALNMDPVLPV